jgi:hypothetical protein
MRATGGTLLVVAILWAIGACEGSTIEEVPPAGTGPGPGTGAAGGAGAAGGGTSVGGSTGGSTPTGNCFDAPPPGAEPPPAAKAYSEGQCPMLVEGRNSLVSGPATREFILALPMDLEPDERVPVIFLWHWLGGEAQDFYDEGDVQAAVDSYRFIAVIPEAKGDLQFQWPMTAGDGQARVDEELTFFDDMLACVSEQFQVIHECVASAGVSAGALWTPVLAGHRGEYLSSMMSLSGGSGGVIQPWQGSVKKMPAMVLWGGPTDNCLGLLSFETMSHTLEEGLTMDGHFLLECIHNCGHSAPPFDAPGATTAFAPLWEFVIDHPYWLAPGQSPYVDALPPAFPDWCSVGMGTATPREGPCMGGGC